MSGSASVSPAVKNLSGAADVLALEEVMGEYLHRRSLLKEGTVGPVWRSKAALARYHIGRKWPSNCVCPQHLCQIWWKRTIARPGSQLTRHGRACPAQGRA